MTALAWLSSWLLALCGIPLVIQAYEQRRCPVTWGFLAMWGLGELGLFIYVFMTTMDTPLLFNYGLNFALVVYLARWKI